MPRSKKPEVVYQVETRASYSRVDERMSLVGYSAVICRVVRNTSLPWACPWYTPGGQQAVDALDPLRDTEAEVLALYAEQAPPPDEWWGRSPEPLQALPWRHLLRILPT